MAGVALVAVVSVFGAVALGRPEVGTPSQSALGSSAPPAGWKLYRDPLGLFTAHMPPGWKASGGVDGTFTMSDRAGSFSGRSEDIKFSDPARGDGSAQIIIHADQINSAFGRQSYCGARTQETLSFNGYPASQIPPSGTVWLFESYNAHFQIDVEIPGVLEPMHSSPMMTTIPPTPTPLPESWVKADRAILATALASFKPATKPLTCG